MITTVEAPERRPTPLPVHHPSLAFFMKHSRGSSPLDRRMIFKSGKGVPGINGVAWALYSRSRVAFSVVNSGALSSRIGVARNRLRCEAGMATNMFGL